MNSQQAPPEPGSDSESGRSSQQHPLEAEQTRTHTLADEQSESESIEDRVHLTVFRYDPEIEDKQEPRFDTFHVPSQEGMTVLDALMYARDHFDSSLTFRHSCRMAVCGSDGFFINGRQRLGCQTQISDLEEPIRVEPLAHMPVIKDLVVDMDSFYERMESVEWYFQTDELPEGEEQRQSPENREKIKMASRCIQCGCCTSSCNVAAGDEQYIGPAAIVKGYRFYMDEREGEDLRQHRLEILERTHGVWGCQTQFSCTTVCPKDIPITEEIQEMKRESIKNDIKFWD